MEIQPGDVVTVEFPGAIRRKRRPAVVVSTTLYHAARPDVVLALLTSQIGTASASTDYALQDWEAAGLHQPTACRVFLATVPAVNISQVGRLTDRDWEEVKERIRLSLAVK